MMYRSAHHAKKIKQSQLFKRPVSNDDQVREYEEKKARQERIYEWMSNIKQFKGKEGA